MFGYVCLALGPEDTHLTADTLRDGNGETPIVPALRTRPKRRGGAGEA